MPTQTAFTPPSYPSPPLGTPHQKPAYNTADSFKPSAAHANFHGQMPNTINAGAFKPRPREMGDEDFGPDGAAAGYFQQPYQDAAYAQAQQAAQPNQWGTAG
jgi:hypothetical protein